MWLGGDDVYDDDDAQNKEERRRESRPANWAVLLMFVSSQNAHALDLIRKERIIF